MPQDTALHKAANQGDLEGCEGILEAGEIEVDAPGAAERTALQRAVGGNHVELAKFLISKGADVNKTDKAGRTSLHWAAIGGHVECVRLLMENGVDLNAKTKSNMTALHGIAEGNRLSCAQLLIGYHEKIEAGEVQGTDIDFDIQDGDGKTALMLAKENKHPEMTGMLKTKKVDGANAGGGCIIS